MRSYRGAPCSCPELKQPAVKMSTGGLIQQRSSADDGGLGQGLKEEVRMGVGYCKTVDATGTKQRVKTKGVRHEKVMATWRSS